MKLESLIVRLRINKDNQVSKKVERNHFKESRQMQWITRIRGSNLAKVQTMALEVLTLKGSKANTASMTNQDIM